MVDNDGGDGSKVCGIIRRAIDNVFPMLHIHTQFLVSNIACILRKPEESFACVVNF